METKIVADSRRYRTVISLNLLEGSFHKSLPGTTASIDRQLSPSYLRNGIHRNTAIDSARIARSNFTPAILSGPPA